MTPSDHAATDHDGSSNKSVSVSRLIAAEPAAIFDLLADPARHSEFDGSGTVVAGSSTNPERLRLGARFGMSMRMGVPYKMSNEVVEFVESERIAWRHFGHHIWRYELEAQHDATLVTETFDWGSARIPAAFYELARYPKTNKANIAKTLERLAAVTESAR